MNTKDTGKERGQFAGQRVRERIWRITDRKTGVMADMVGLFRHEAVMPLWSPLPRRPLSRRLADIKRPDAG